VRAVFIRRYGGPEVVEIGEQAEPPMRPDDLRVQVHAASVNPVDFKIRAGALKVLAPYRFPLVLGNDLSGVVTDVGAQVTRFRPGDAVFARLDKDRIGSFAEIALVRESAAALKPKNLDHLHAASLPLVGLTSWQAMIDLAHLERGHKVLIHAGSGGIGTFAIQLARHLGATTCTTTSARHFELVRQLGAEVVVDYKTQRFEEVCRDCDMVFDTLGGETQERSFTCLRRGGVMVSIAGTPDAKFARARGLNPLVVAVLAWKTRTITRRARQSGTRFEYLFMRPSGEQLSQIAALVEREVIRPVLDRVFALGEAKEALAYSESGRATGKVVLRIDH
jgi:alcohol dehydrogenase